MPELKAAWGYQGDNMSLPVADSAAAAPFYETVLGFRVAERRDSPPRSVILARDAVRIGLVENGGDSSQDGCAFEVDDVESLFAQFKTNGLAKADAEFDVEHHDGKAWKVFYVVAPDGLCFWFGQRMT